MKKFWLLTITMLALTGCPDKGSSNRNNYLNPVGPAACVGCGYSQGVLTNSISSSLPQGTLTLNLMGDGSQMSMIASQWGANPAFGYQGPIRITGTLNLVTDLFMGMCRLPMGNYTVQTLQQGIYNVGVFEVPQLELIGPVRALVNLSEGVVLTDGMGTVTGFGAVLRGIQGPQMSWGGYINNGNCTDFEGVRF